MVGANCSIFWVFKSRKKSGVAIFEVPQGDDKWSSNWRKSLKSVVTKDRVIDKSRWECSNLAQPDLFRKKFKIFLYKEKKLEIIFPTTSPNREIQCILFQKRQVTLELLQYHLLLQLETGTLVFQPYIVISSILS